MNSTSPPSLVLLASPPALARSMTHALLQAWAERSHQTDPPEPAQSWQCLAPELDQDWAAQSPSDCVIYLLGLDWRDLAGLEPETASRLMAQHAQWREQLQQLKRPFVVLYGSPARQWSQLVESLKMIATSTDVDWLKAENPLKPSTRLRSRHCEQCGDPECERRLFEALQLGNNS